MLGESPAAARPLLRAGPPLALCYTSALLVLALSALPAGRASHPLPGSECQGGGKGKGINCSGLVALFGLPVWWAAEMPSALSELDFHQFSANLVALPALCQTSSLEAMKQESMPCSTDAMLKPDYELPDPENPSQAGKVA
ncbi:hypothetical protein BTVI_158537 [Pitangus sulphuratus]|nr:hypothetical protein BTVI_158537 [Pitangus sulphuratus]